jgi:hypothetical protein
MHAATKLIAMSMDSSFPEKSPQPAPDTSGSNPAGSGLQFDRAEFTPGTGAGCEFCKGPLGAEYFQVNGKAACVNCHGHIEQHLAGGSQPVRVLRAAAAGIGAAVAGFAVYWAIRATTGYEFGLVAILVGWMVGMAVRWGAFRRGGIFYQLLAVVLTYLAIASTYVPDILEGMHQAAANAQVEAATPAPGASNADQNSARDSVNESETPARESSVANTAATDRKAPLWIEVIVAFSLGIIAPFLMGTSNIIGWIIIAFGLMQAWRLNGRIPVQIAGPFPAGTRLPSQN